METGSRRAAPYAESNADPGSKRRKGTRMRHARFLVLAAGLMLLAQGAARAQNYKIQPIAKFGDKVGSLTIKTDESDFEVGSLNDAGQLVFVTESEAGGEMLVQYS